MTSQKISNFNVSTTLNTSDLFTFVVNGTNKSILFSDFQTALGVTGSITQVGDPLGAPVLNTPSANTYNIRNLEPSKGMTFTISPQDGILGACNFIQDSGGLTIVEDLNADVYNIRTIKAEAPIQVTIENNAIVIKDTGSPVAATNTVIVSTIDDFPTAIAGVITLDDDINYILVQPITTPNRFVLGANNSITSNNPFSPLFTYTGTGTLFTGVDVNLTMHDILISCASGQVFDMAGTTTGPFLVLTLVIVVACDKYGTFDDMGAVDITNSSAVPTSQGITVTGSTNWEIFSLDKFSFVNASATFIAVDLGTSVHKTLKFVDFIVTGVAGGIVLSGAASSANLGAGRLAMVLNSEFLGGMTVLSGISLDDIRWDFSTNAGLADSFSDALVSVNNNATATVISIVNTPVKAAGTFTTEIVSRFTHDGTGRITYIGERNLRVPVTISCTLLQTGGGTDNLTAYLAMNGSVITNSGITLSAESGDGVNATVVWQTEFAQNDFVELFVENNSDTSNITVTDAVLRSN